MAEVLFQRVQRRKRAGMQALSIGDYAEAERILEGVVRLIKRHWGSIPRARRDEFAAEIDFVDGLNARASSGVHSDMAFASKLMSADIVGKSRSRGRGSV